MIFLFFYFVIRAATPFFWVGDPLFLFFGLWAKLGRRPLIFGTATPRIPKNPGFRGSTSRGRPDWVRGTARALWGSQHQKVGVANPAP